MKSWVSQLVKTHGEMWRTAALLLIGFYSSCQCRCLNRARISFKGRGTNKLQSSFFCYAFNIASISVCLATCVFIETCGAKRSAEGRIVFVENPVSVLLGREPARSGVVAVLWKQPSQTVQPEAVAAMLDKCASAQAPLIMQRPPKPTESFHRVKVRKV